MIEFDQADVDRFMSFVEKLPNGCWFWAGGRSRGKGNKKWYGSFWLKGKSIRAHRFSCEALADPPKECPPEHDRDHTCLFSLCVNPDHLDIISKEENHRLKIERRTPRVLKDHERFVLGLALEGDGHLAFSLVYSRLEVSPDRAWTILNGMRNFGLLEHIAYNDWKITESGRLAWSLAAKQKIKEEA